jgi:hypothetical protein
MKICWHCKLTPEIQCRIKSVPAEEAKKLIKDMTLLQDINHVSFVRH